MQCPLCIALKLVGRVFVLVVVRLNRVQVLGVSKFRRVRPRSSLLIGLVLKVQGGLSRIRLKGLFGIWLCEVSVSMLFAIMC